MIIACNISVQEVISRLDSRTLRPVNVQGLLVFSNTIKNGYAFCFSFSAFLFAFLFILIVYFVYDINNN